MTTESSSNSPTKDESSSSGTEGEELFSQNELIHEEISAKGTQKKDDSSSIQLKSEDKGDSISVKGELLVEPTQGTKIGVSSSEKRANIKLYIAGGLAISLWVSLILVMGFHLFTVNQLSQRLATISSDAQSNQATYIKDAIAANNDTAKTLYTFLTPLAAGITGYFFEEAKKEN